MNLALDCRPHMALSVYRSCRWSQWVSATLPDLRRLRWGVGIDGSCRQTSQVLWVSSGVGHDVCPGGVFVVGGVGLQASVQDADEAVGELTECGFMADLAVAELVVVGGGSW